jgi:hypothetical protein
MVRGAFLRPDRESGVFVAWECDKFRELSVGELDRNRRGYGFLCRCEHDVIASFEDD